MIAAALAHECSLPMRIGCISLFAQFKKTCPFDNHCMSFLILFGPKEAQILYLVVVNKRISHTDPLIRACTRW